MANRFFLKKMMHTQEYYLAIKQNEFTSFIK